MVAAPDVAVSTPVHISPEALKASHAAQAVTVDEAKVEAKMDIKTLLQSTDKAAREHVSLLLSFKGEVPPHLPRFFFSSLQLTMGDF